SVGPFSKAFCSLRIGDKIWLSGPYGNAFTLHGKKVMLVGGGYGTGPMRYLAQLAALNGIEPVIVMGARNKERLMKHPGNVRTFVSTDDGSEGRKGMVTELINHLLGLEKFDAIYACGPEKMMGAIAKIAEEKGIKCQLLLERFMKCGFGMCGQCSIGEGLVCVDGPVYDSSIAKHPEFGKFHRDRCGLKVKL
ncbi:dihydroorotate dehydrogenase electron transfer subunit, partial [Candidatus Parvarchaeota archaeon]|nr:dihydroorotate dehydrogenase electron transfer subunit [Candidatus Parvarchaeota archaeon]